MNRKELAPILRQEYESGRPCGVTRVREPKYKNLWFVVPPRPPEEAPVGLPTRMLAKAHQRLERVPRLNQADALDHLVSYLFLRREAVQSSRMEGTWSTIDHVLTPGELYEKKERRSARASVLGYAHALEEVFSRCEKAGPKILTPSIICSMHQKVMGKDPQFRGKPGKLREAETLEEIVFIGGLHRTEESIYNPTPPRFVARCLNQVMDWFRNEEIIELGDAGMGMSLPVRMAVGHAHFEAVHPFTDGNGRVGRMLLALQMVCHGILPLYLSGFIEVEKTFYGRALQQAQKKLKYAEIVEFFCEAIVASFDEAEKTKMEICDLPGGWEKRGDFREHSAAQRSLSWISQFPLFTVKNLQDHLRVSPPAANRAVGQLVEKRIIRERTGYGRNRLFAAEEVIELLSRPFGEDIKVALNRAKTALKATT